MAHATTITADPADSPPRHARRRTLIFAIVALVLFVAVLGVVKLLQVRAAIAKAASFRPPPEAVTTAVVREEAWPEELHAVGSAVAVQGVTVSADLPGVVDEIAFESGQLVHEGDLLVALDVREETAALASAKAQRVLARSNFARGKTLGDSGVVAAAELDQLRAAAQQSNASAAQISATIDRKRIRAPFTGTVGIRRVNLGQYLAPGTAIVTLETLDPIYVRFSVPQDRLARIEIGAAVRIATAGADEELPGTITAIDLAVDEATRNAEVQATIANADRKLQPGMFVDVRIVLDARQRMLTVPATAISHAPYGDSVWVVDELTDDDGNTFTGVRQQFVELAGTRGDLVALRSGLAEGDEVVSAGGFKLRPNAPVQVNNEIQPSADPSPRPENR